MFQRVCIASFSVYRSGRRTAINGMIEPLLLFFQKRAKIIDLIDGPHPGSDRVATIFEEYQGDSHITQESVLGKLLTPLLTTQNQNGTQLMFKIRDLSSVFELVMTHRKKYDLFIGLESIFTLAGIILKKFGMAKTVVYYVSDYSPSRYSQKILNDFYLWLDRFCCYHADYIWDVSKAMLPARISVGLDKKKCRPLILVPNALFSTQIDYLPESKLEKNSIVFAGTFGYENGTKLAIEAMRYVLEKIPDATLHMFGGGKELEVHLQEYAQSLHLGIHIVFHGFIANASKLSSQIKRYKIGVAPYIGIPGSARWYADATKIRLYLGAGLPTITTQVPPLGKEVEKAGAAIVTLDNAQAFANTIINLLLDEKKLKKMRESAISYAKTNTWEKSYSDAVAEMGLSDK